MEEQQPSKLYFVGVRVPPGALVVCFGLCRSVVDHHLGTMEVVRSIRTIGSFVICIVTNLVENVK